MVTGGRHHTTTFAQSWGPSNRYTATSHLPERIMSGVGAVTSGSRHQPAFQLPSSSSSSSPPSPRQTFPSGSDDGGSDDDAPLPFPTALSRRDFLAPDFNAAEYLSSLFPDAAASTPSADVHVDEQGRTGAGAGGLGMGMSSLVGTRHQTLEDLRAELRERSGGISAELLELVNANYTSFLGLGDELHGGEERVEDVRVGLLGFRRQVEEVRGRVRGRRDEVARAGAELRGVRGQVAVGRRMLELDERLDVLLGRLEEAGDDDEDGDSDDEDTDGGEDGGEGSFTGSSPALLMELATEYRRIERLADAIGRDLPYVKKMEERITRCRNTLLVDLGTSMKEARKAKEKGRDRVLRLLAVYRLLGAHGEGIKILKEK